MSLYVLAFLIGVVAGLRSLRAPAVLSWAARLGWLHLENTGLAFLAYARTRYLLSVLAVVELVADKLPKTPTRKAPASFAARLVTGGLCGAAFGAASPSLIGEVLAGVGGSVVGTLGGHEFRVRLVKALGGNDLPIALVEDVIAIGGALLIAHATSVS